MGAAEQEGVGLLEEHIESTRAEIAACLLEIDEITLQVNPQIESDYAVKIGCLETDLLRCQIEARRAKRRLALVQAQANRGEDITEGIIEEQLDQEFSVWQLRLQQAVDDYLAKAERRAGSRMLSPADSREMKRLHRELIKRLHPDVRPDLGGEGLRYFEIAQKAFEAGDLQLLRSVEAATMYMARKPDELNTPEELIAECALVEAQLQVVWERLDALKHSLPYTLMEKLANPVWVQKTVEGLKAQIKQQEEAREAYDRRISELKGE